MNDAIDVHCASETAPKLKRTNCERYLSALFGGQRGSIELRWSAHGFHRAFYPTSRLDDVHARIHKMAPNSDVYVGVLPRAKQASTRAALADGQVLWCDFDGPAVLEPHPSIVVASGTGDNCHAYWLLRAPLTIDNIEAANRQLAERLGADLASCDAARILRPPSLNHKHNPPTEVRLIHCDPAIRYDIKDLVDLSAIEPPRPAAPSPRGSGDDPLLEISPTVYVEKLAGLRIPRSGVVACPFHPDDTPSLKLYRDPERGWYCYGCRRGGSIYDFGAALWDVEPRGRDFIALREHIVRTLSFGRVQVDPDGSRLGPALGSAVESHAPALLGQPCQGAAAH